VRQTYTKMLVGYTDNLPKKIDINNDAASSLIDRTLMRPRYLIEFLKDVIGLAAGKPDLMREMIFTSESL
jgi:hypothetical protein